MRCLDRRLPFIALFAVLGSLAAPAAAQKIFRCTGPNGQAVFQQSPCHDGREVNSAPANIVDGNPAGERQTRQRAQRDAEIRAAMQAGRVVPGMSEAQLLQVWGQPVDVATEVRDGVTLKRQVFNGPTGERVAITEEGVVTATRLRPAKHKASPAAEPCHNEQEIRNAFTEASSTTISAERRRALQKRAEAMQRCP